jgi:hypothetical protein
MSRRTALPFVLVVIATLQCGDVLGQGSPEAAPPDAPGETTGGEEAPNEDPAHDRSCLEDVAASGTLFTRAATDDEPPTLTGCGLLEGVSVSRGPTGIQYRPPIRVSCAFARTLPAVEQIIQATAAEVLAEPIEVARTMGSYGCRTIQSARSPGRLSEHAVGNAIDVGEWWTRGTRANVLRDFRGEGREGELLRAIAARLGASGVLERLLDPDYDAAHRNHFHLEGHPLPLP